MSRDPLGDRPVVAGPLLRPTPPRSARGRPSLRASRGCAPAVRRGCASTSACSSAPSACRSSESSSCGPRPAASVPAARAALKQLVALGVGMACAAAVTRLDVRVVRAAAPVVYVLAVLGLAAVVSPLGSTVNGSRSWIRLPGGMSLQPSELMKVALAIGLAMLLAERAERGLRQRHRDVALAWVVAGIPVVLVLAQPDLGSALVLVAMSVVIIAAAGRRGLWTLGVVVVGAAAVGAAFLTPVLSGYQRNRLRAFLDPSLDPQGIGYQTRQVRIADRLGRPRRPGSLRGSPDPGRVHPVPGDRLRLLRRGGGARLPRRGRARRAHRLHRRAVRRRGTPCRRVRPPRRDRRRRLARACRRSRTSG